MIKTEIVEKVESLISQLEYDSKIFHIWLIDRYENPNRICHKCPIDIYQWINCDFFKEISSTALVKEIQHNLLYFNHENGEYSYLSRINLLIGRVKEILKTCRYLRQTDTMLLYSISGFSRNLSEDFFSYSRIKMHLMSGGYLSVHWLINHASEQDIEVYEYDRRIKEILYRSIISMHPLLNNVPGVAKTSRVATENPDKFVHLFPQKLVSNILASSTVQDTNKSVKDTPTKDQILLLNELGIFGLPAIRNMTAENRGKLFAKLLNRNEKNVTEYIRNCDPNGNMQADDNPYIYENKVTWIKQFLKGIGFIKK